MSMKVASQLEDSLTVAASALALVKSVEPNIITIQVAKSHGRFEEGERDYLCSLCQCFINEESLDYLLFKKLPMNVYSKMFTKSTDLGRQPNTCVAWKVPPR